MYDGYSRSRFSEQRSRKKKKDFVLNILIAIVFVLIIIVAAYIFFGDKKEQASTPENTPAETKPSESEEKDDDTGTKEEKPVQEEHEEEADKDRTGSDHTNPDENEQDEGDNPEEMEETTEQKVLDTIIDPSWEPIGTVQEGEHITVYGGVDWDEMVEAITYATGLQKDNMTIKFLGNNGHNKSSGTVYSKNKEEIYKVYIEWVDGRGWKPTKVEVLSSIE